MSNFDEDLATLEDWLRRLKVEYDIFFNGHRKKPPEDMRLRLEKLVKKLSESAGMSFGQRFRYTTLIGHFYIYRDRWRRRLAELESGVEAKEQVASAKQTAAPKEKDEMEVSISISNPPSDQNEIRRLYEAVNRLRGSRGNTAPAMPYSQFADYISSQTTKLKERSGCQSVKFTLAVVGDAVKFTAKPEKKP